MHTHKHTHDDLNQQILLLYSKWSRIYLHLKIRLNNTKGLAIDTTRGLN